jgi:hypothetical protein
MKKRILIILAIVFSTMLSIAQTEDPNVGHRSIGLSYLENKMYGPAIKEFDLYLAKADVKYKYRIVTTYHLRAYCKYMLSDFNSAIEDYNVIILLCEKWSFETTEEYSGAYYYKGMCEAISGNNELGCSDLAIAVRLGHLKASNLYINICNH